MTRRTQAPVAQRRAELLQAALRVMRRDGAWALTTRAVAAEANLPHGLVHYAFSSKQALVQAVIRIDTERAIALLDSAAAAGGTTEQVLGRAFSAYADAVRCDPETELAAQELTLMAVRDESLRPLAQQWSQDYRTSAVHLLEHLAIRHHGTWDAAVEVIADQTLALVLALTTDWLVTRDDDRFETALADAARMVAARLLPAGPAGI